MAVVYALYLHGFLSSGKSSKGMWFKSKAESNETCGVDLNFEAWKTPTYPIGKVEDTIEFIENEVKTVMQKSHQGLDASLVVLIGSSMGGFYSQYFAHKYHLPFVMINPALNPEKVFSDHLGEYQNPSTGEMVKIDQNYIDNLKSYKIEKPDLIVPSLLLIDKDDEVIDVNFALDMYPCNESNESASKTVVFEGGDHSFIHLEEAWGEIYSFLNNIQKQ